MKKIYVLLLVIVLTSVSAIGQKNITIDFSVDIDTVKNILGGNRLWLNTVGLIQDEGIEQIRIHDYHDAGDYCFYSNFWNRDNNGDFTTINTNFDPNNPDDYDWTATDDIVDQIISNNFQVFFRMGVSYPNPSIPPMAPYGAPSNSQDDPLNFSRFPSLSEHTVMQNNQQWENGFA